MQDNTGSSAFKLQGTQSKRFTVQGSHDTSWLPLFSMHPWALSKYVVIGIAGNVRGAWKGDVLERKTRKWRKLSRKHTLQFVHDRVMWTPRIQFKALHRVAAPICPTKKTKKKTTSQRFLTLQSLFSVFYVRRSDIAAGRLPSTKVRLPAKQIPVCSKNIIVFSV